MPTLITRGAASSYGFGFGSTPAVLADPYFNYTTLLLPGNGTNGAQNNTFLDSSTNNFTITRNGDTTQGTFSPFSQTGWSNYLSNATGSYIVAANNSSYVFGTGDFTVEFWVYWPQPSTSSETRLMAIGSDYPSSGLGLVIYRASGDTCKARVLGNSTGGTEYTIASGASDWANKWVHMAVTRSGSTLRTFLSGTLITSASNSSDLNGTNGIQFGRYPPGGDLFTGYLSNVRLTKGAALYTASFTPPTAPLTTTVSSGTVGFLGFQSNRFVDNSGNNITLTPTGTPSVEAFSPFNPTAAYSAATVGGSGYFDGSGDYLTIADNVALQLGSGDFCIEWWMYPTAAGSNPIMWGEGSGGGGNYFNIHYNISGNGKIQVFIDALSGSYVMESGVLSANAWTHVAVTRSGSTFRLFINGTQAATYSNAGSVNSGPLNIGSSYVGYISDSRTIKGSAVYTSNFTPPTAPLTAITNTSLLLNFTNAGIIDNTAKNDLQTVGNAQISTTQSKFGGASMYFDGSGDAVITAASPLFQLITNWTIEGWFYTNSRTGDMRYVTVEGSFYVGLICGGGGSGGSTNDLVLNRFGSGDWIRATNALTGSDNTWNHIAIVCSNGTIKLYFNGTNVGGTSSNTMPTGNCYITAGASVNYPSYNYNGYIDDLRVTTGIARYTGNFTPPTAAFPLK
jgi:hypothetical protein